MLVPDRGTRLGRDPNVLEDLLDLPVSVPEGVQVPDLLRSVVLTCDQFRGDFGDSDLGGGVLGHGIVSFGWLVLFRRTLFLFVLLIINIWGISIFINEKRGNNILLFYVCGE